jgi:hypothetical protein
MVHFRAILGLGGLGGAFVFLLDKGVGCLSERRRGLLARCGWRVGCLELAYSA